MKKAKKILTLVACAVLLVCISVGATIAYLTAQDAVTNTFTVGNIQMKMDETDVDNSTEDKDRDQANTYPRIQPNATLDKDPIVWLKKDSEKAYVFIEVTNELAGLEATGDTAKPTIDAQIKANGWTELQANIYYKVVDPATAAASTMADYTDYIQLDTFTKVYIGNADNGTLQTYNGKQIIVNAYAIQYLGFENKPADAWTAVKAAYTAQP